MATATPRPKLADLDPSQIPTLAANRMALPLAVAVVLVACAAVLCVRHRRDGARSWAGTLAWVGVQVVALLGLAAMCAMGLIHARTRAVAVCSLVAGAMGVLALLRHEFDHGRIPHAGGDGRRHDACGEPGCDRGQVVRAVLANVLAGAVTTVAAGRRARAVVEPVRARGRPPGLCGRVRLRGPGHPGGRAAGTAARRPRGTSRGGPVRHRTHPVLRHPLQGTAPHARRHPRRGHRDGRERRLLLHPLGRDAQVDRLRASWRRRLLADPSRRRHPPPRLAPRGHPRGGEHRLRGHDRHLRGHASLRGHGPAS